MPADKSPLGYTGRQLASTTKAGLVQFNSSDFSLSEGVVSLASGAVSSLSALSDTTIAGLASGDILVYDGSDSFDNVVMSGDAAITSAGVVTVSDLTIASEARGDLLRRGASAWERVAAATSGQILVGDGTDVVSVAVSGDATLSAAGALSVSDLTIASEAQGDILYFNGSNWVRLAAGTSGQSLVTSGAGANPYWGAPNVANATSLANNVTCEAGASDYTLDFGTAGGAYTLTVPAVAGSRTFAFINEAQTFSAVQTFAQSGVLLQGGDSNALIPKANETLTADRTLNLVVNDADRTIDLSGNLTLGGSWTHTGAHTVGITTQNNGTFAFADASAYALTFPTGTDILVARDSTDTLTNKTLTSAVLNTGVSGTAVLDEDDMSSDSATQIATQQSIKAYVDSGTVTFTNKSFDCDGSGNSLTNVNADELDPVAAPSLGDATDSVYCVPFVLKVNISNQGAAVNVYSSNAPFKFKVLDAWSVNKSADGGTWKIDNGTNDLCSAVTVGASDTDIDRLVDLDDAYATIASSGSLRVVPDAGGALDCDIYIMAVRVD